MKSFQLYRPRCPQCGSAETRGALSFKNIYLFLLALIIIQAGFYYKCKSCNHCWHDCS